MMNYTYYQGLCVKSFTGNILENEKKKLDDWIQISEKNKKEYQKMIDIWQNSIPKQAPVLPDIDEEWFAISNRIENGSNMSLKKLRKYEILSVFTTGIRFKPIYVGAVVTMVIAFALFFMIKQNHPVTKNVIYASERDNRIVHLLDGSTVL